MKQDTTVIKRFLSAAYKTTLWSTAQVDTTKKATHIKTELKHKLHFTYSITTKGVNQITLLYSHKTTTTTEQQLEIEKQNHKQEHSQRFVYKEKSRHVAPHMQQ